MYETDSEKRGYATSAEDLKELWRKAVKYQVMTRVADMVEAENKKARRRREVFLPRVGEESS